MWGGRSVPQNVQQQIIRAYCEKNGLQFLLSATEFENHTTMLDAIQEAGIVMYSIFCLPKDKDARMRLYNSDKDVRFAAENIHKIDIDFLETTFKINELYARDELPAIVAQLNKA